MNLILDGNMNFAKWWYVGHRGPHGFYNCLASLVKRWNPDEIHIAFDSPRSWRRDLYPNYKANRPAKPDGYSEALSATKIALAQSGFAIYEVDGYEADDVISSLRRKLSGYTLIVSDDKDILQLVGPMCLVLRHGQKWGTEDVKDHFGVCPKQLPIYLALVGDSADNIPGITGLGPIRAASLLFGWAITLDSIYANLPKGKLGRTMELQREEAYMYLQLTTLAMPDVTPTYGHYDLKRYQEVLRER